LAAATSPRFLLIPLAVVSRIALLVYLLGDLLFGGPAADEALTSANQRFGKGVSRWNAGT
jgi:hypothetical protein